jgi:hypothetical protein
MVRLLHANSIDEKKALPSANAANPAAAAFQMLLALVKGDY